MKQPDPGAQRLLQPTDYKIVGFNSVYINVKCFGLMLRDPNKGHTDMCNPPLSFMVQLQGLLFLI